jgi:hypothetical protein
MKALTQDVLSMWRKKSFAAIVILSAIFAYGYLVTHHTVGIDDTPYAYYFRDGLSAIVGRWVFFVFNKVISVWRLAPFVTDLAGVMIFTLGVSVWAVLLERIFGQAIPSYGYGIFGALLLTNPLHSEVFTYYLHNGVGTGYLFTGIALIFYLEGIRWKSGRRCNSLEDSQTQASEVAGSSGQVAGGQKRYFHIVGIWKYIDIATPFVVSALCLWIAIGCYESFMAVYLVGVCLLLCSRRIIGERGKIIKNLLLAVGVGIGALLLRSLMMVLVIRVFGLEALQDDAVARSVTEMLGWMREPGAYGELTMLIKRLMVMYGVFAYAYYPIAVYVVTAGFMLIYGLWRSIRQKDGWILLLVLGSVAASYLLAVVEGKATYYRSAQFLPLVCAWGGLLILYALKNLERIHLHANKNSRVNAHGKISVGTDSKMLNKVKLQMQTISCRMGGIISIVTAVAGLMVLWNQCVDMNHWFYIDTLKFENAKYLSGQIYEELARNYDLSKPVIFTGEYQVPKSIIADAYVEIGSETFYQMNRITSAIDPHLLEKFYREYGVWVAQTPSLSVLQWGKNAFDSDEELVRFFAMQGYDIKPWRDEAIYIEAEIETKSWPSFPKEGSIQDMGDYIIVHF